MRNSGHADRQFENWDSHAEISHQKKEHILRVSIFGLGYVGTVCAGCLAKEGHEIVGVDPVRTKVELINAGKSPIIEADIEEIIAEAVKSGRLRATDDSVQAIRDTDISFVCVGTPSQINGNLDLTHVRHVCEQIGPRAQGQDGAAYCGDSQHDPARNNAPGGHPGTGRNLRKEGRQGFRGLQ